MKKYLLYLIIINLLSFSTNNLKSNDALFAKGHMVHDLKLNVKLKASDDSNDMLAFVLKHAEVNHFVEVIPSVNDIYIKSVNSN